MRHKVLEVHRDEVHREHAADLFLDKIKGGLVKTELSDDVKESLNNKSHYEKIISSSEKKELHTPDWKDEVKGEFDACGCSIF